jgi:hypothetical protein
MPKRTKLDFNQPMTWELVARIIDKEMEMEKQPEEKKMALHYMTQMVEQGYAITNDPAERYTIQEMMDLTYAYLDGYHDAARTLGLSLKKLFDNTNNPLMM